MPGNTAQIQVGRLLEIRAGAGYRSVDEVRDLFHRIGQAVAKLPPGSKHVTVVDWRKCPIMEPAAAEFLVKQMTSVNPGTLRSAAIARQDAPLHVLQFVRVIRDAGFSDRTLFFAEAELCTWLAEVLTPAEQTRLREFLAE